MDSQNLWPQLFAKVLYFLILSSRTILDTSTSIMSETKRSAGEQIAGLDCWRLTFQFLLFVFVSNFSWKAKLQK